MHKIKLMAYRALYYLVPCLLPDLLSCPFSHHALVFRHTAFITLPWATLLLLQALYICCSLCLELFSKIYRQVFPSFHSNLCSNVTYLKKPFLLTLSKIADPDILCALIQLFFIAFAMT